MSWPVVPFPDVLEDVTGGNEKTKQSDYAAIGAYPIVDQGQSLIGGYTDDASSLCKTDAPVIIFGDHTKALKYVDFPFCLGADGTKVLKPKPHADTKYLYYALHNIHIPEAGYSRHFKYLKAGKIPLPPLEEQKRIAGILDQADALRRLRTRALDKLNILGQAIFHEMFGDPVTNPMNWPKIKIRDAVAKISDGPFGSNLKSSHYTDEGIRVWRLQNIGVGEVKNDDQAFVSPEHFATLKKHECLPGDVIVGTLGDPNLRACIQPSSMEVALNKADCVQIRPDDSIALADFWLGALNHPATLTLAHSAVLGQTRARISMGRLREIELPIPPLNLQKEYRSRMTELQNLKNKYAHKGHFQNTLFAAFQHRAFRGQL